MSNIIIKPLHVDPTWIKIWVTSLEAFWNCPKKFKEVPYTQTEQQKFWVIADDTLKTFLKNKWHYAKVEEYFIEKWRDKHEQKRISDYIWLADELPEIFISDYKIEINVECWPYLVTIRWILDWIHLDDDICDFKTYKTRRRFWDEFKKLQPYLYTYWYWKDKWITKWTKFFHFYNFSKHKKKACQLDKRTVQVDLEETEQLIKDIVKKYVVAYHSKEFIAKENSFCKICPLYKNWECYKYNTLLVDNEILWKSS